MLDNNFTAMVSKSSKYCDALKYEVGDRRKKK